jgi:septal ring factor EnvC (AmiA/AmiB activator)
MSDITEDEAAGMRAEIERLKAELDEEEKAVFAAMKMLKERDAEIERLRDQQISAVDGMLRAEQKLDEAAAFLDELARRIEWHSPNSVVDAAADCRAMAKKLRGET